MKAARQVALKKSQPWHDTDDIEGHILYELSSRQPLKEDHIWRVAWNAKADWIRKERGNKGQKTNIRDTFPLDPGLRSSMDLSEKVANKIDYEVMIEKLYRESNEIEKQILDMLRDGYNQAQIARKVGLSSTLIARKISKIKNRLSAST